jgi:hypothetical protein
MNMKGTDMTRTNVEYLPEPSDECMRIIARGILRAPNSPPQAIRRACDTLRNSPHADDRLMAAIRCPDDAKPRLVTGEEAWQRAHEFPKHKRSVWDADPWGLASQIVLAVALVAAVAVGIVAMGL